MHTIMMVGAGIVALAVFAVAAAVMWGSATKGAWWFLAAWLIVALVNLYVGTSQGHSLIAEIGFFLIVFGLPAFAAWGVTRIYSR